MLTTNVPTGTPLKVYRPLDVSTLSITAPVDASTRLTGDRRRHQRLAAVLQPVVVRVQPDRVPDLLGKESEVAAPVVIGIAVQVALARNILGRGLQARPPSLERQKRH